ARARARLAARSGDTDQAVRWFKRAVSSFREFTTPFHLARAQLEYAELLASIAGGAEEAAALRDEAVGVFEALRAKPWLERAYALGSAVAAWSHAAPVGPRRSPARGSAGSAGPRPRAGVRRATPKNRARTCSADRAARRWTRRLPRRPPSGGSCLSCSRIWSGSRRCPSTAIQRRFGSCCRCTSSAAGR